MASVVSSSGFVRQNEPNIQTNNMVLPKDVADIMASPGNLQYLYNMDNSLKPLSYNQLPLIKSG